MTKATNCRSIRPPMGVCVHAHNASVHLLPSKSVFCHNAHIRALASCSPFQLLSTS